MNDPTRIAMTVAEYRAMPESSQPTELIDGVLHVRPTPRCAHQSLVFILAQWIDALPTAGTTIISPMDLYLDAATVVQPDLFWVQAESSACRLGDDGYWYGAPDLVVEVLSPSTALRDRGLKFERYQAAGVREYWMADPEGCVLEVFALEGDHFRRLGAYGEGDTLPSPVLGQSLTLTGLQAES